MEGLFVVCSWNRLAYNSLRVCRGYSGTVMMLILNRVNKHYNPLESIYYLLLNWVVYFPDKACLFSATSIFCRTDE